MDLDFNEVRTAGFDYTSLEPDIASQAKDAAGHIRSILRQTTVGIIEAGQRLRTIKDRLPHGQFTRWVAAEFGMSERAARLYMNAAEFAAGKTETVAVLQPTTVYALAAPSTPDTVKVGVLERLEHGDTITDREIKQLISQAKSQSGGTDEGKAPIAIETNLTGTVPAKSEHNIWLVEPVNTDQEPATVEPEVRKDPLATAIHAVKLLSADDLADFHRWYQNAFQVAADPESIDGDAMPGDDPIQLALAPEHAPEQDEVDIEDDPLIAMWRSLKINPQKYACYWVGNGAPEVVPWQEHHVTAETVRPWREAYSAAPHDRQEAVRRWLEKQQL